MTESSDSQNERSYPYPPNTKAKDVPHHCPVCRRLYYPRHTRQFKDQAGTMLVEVSDSICVKGTDGWVMVYWHHPETESRVAATDLTPIECLEAQ